MIGGKITGETTALLRNLGRLITKRSQGASILNAAAKPFLLPMARQLRSEAPRRTGALRRSVTRVSGFGRAGRWGAAVGYSFTKNNTSRARSGVNKVLAVVYGARGTSGTDTLNRAWRAHRPTAQAFARELRRAIEEFQSRRREKT